MRNITLIDDISALAKVAFSVTLAITTAIPFRMAWNTIMPTYFGDIVPVLFHNIPYWHFVGMLLICTFVGEQIQKLTPKLASINVANN